MNNLNVIVSSSEIRWLSKIISRKNKLIKMTWLLLHIFLASACCIYVFRSISDYFDNQVFTKTTVTNQIPSEFPTITICQRLEDNLNNFFKKNKQELKNLSLNEIKLYFVLKNSDLLELEKKTFDFDFKNLIPSCLFNGKPCDYENDFTLSYDIIYGNCIKFNSGKRLTGDPTPIKNIDQQEKIFGLNLIINTNSNYLSKQESTGFHIMIHNSSIDPISSDGFDISSGVETHIAINRLFISKKPYPYSDCVSNTDNHGYEFLNSTYRTGFDYRQDECFLFCAHNFVADNKEMLDN